MSSNKISLVQPKCLPDNEFLAAAEVVVHFSVSLTGITENYHTISALGETCSGSLDLVAPVNSVDPTLSNNYYFIACGADLTVVNAAYWVPLINPNSIYVAGKSVEYRMGLIGMNDDHVIVPKNSGGHLEVYKFITSPIPALALTADQGMGFVQAKGISPIEGTQASLLFGYNFVNDEGEISIVELTEGNPLGSITVTLIDTVAIGSETYRQIRFSQSHPPVLFKEGLVALTLDDRDELTISDWRSCTGFTNCHLCNTTQCLVCQPPTELVGTTCQAPLVCTDYHPSCLTCDSNTCLSCQAPTVVSGTGCDIPCNIYDPNCATCDASSCLSCQAPTVLEGTTCGLDCTFYDSNCATCDTSACLTCQAPTVLVGTVCELDCTSFGPNCATCDNTGCLSCQLDASGNEYNLNGNNECQIVCGQGQAWMSQSNTCSQCGESCLECEQDSLVCTTCDADTLIDEGNPSDCLTAPLPFEPEGAYLKLEQVYFDEAESTLFFYFDKILSEKNYTQILSVSDFTLQFRQL